LYGLFDHDGTYRLKYQYALPSYVGAQLHADGTPVYDFGSAFKGAAVARLWPVVAGCIA
jgi:hypothetical protein